MTDTNTSNEYRVTVRRSGLTDEMRGWSGRATYAGVTNDGEDVYRVVFGEPGFEQSARFRASDLSFEQRW